MRLFGLNVVTRLNDPREKNPKLQRAKKCVLANDSFQWLQQLAKVAESSRIPYRAVLCPSSAPREHFTHLLIDAHFDLQPHVGNDIQKVMRDRNFGIYLILTYQEVPVADWKQGLSFPLIHAMKGPEGILIPSEGSLTRVDKRIRCRSMGSFTSKEMHMLLDDTMAIVSSN